MSDVPADPRIMELLRQARIVPELWRGSPAAERAPSPPATRVRVVGSGDSGVAARLIAARHHGTGIPVSAHSPAERMAPRPADLVVGISASGGNPCLADVLTAARTAGGATVAVTCRPGSQVTAVADRTVVAETPSRDASPACLTHVATLLAADRVVSSAVARSALAQSTDLVCGRPGAEAGTADAVTAEVMEIATVVADRLDGDSVPAIAAATADLDTAHFIAAKIMECTGMPVLCQDLDTWTHVGRFATRGPLLVWAPQSAEESPDLAFLGHKARGWCESVTVVGPPVLPWATSVRWPVTSPDGVAVWSAVFGAVVAARMALRQGTEPFNPGRTPGPGREPGGSRPVAGR